MSTSRIQGSPAVGMMEVTRSTLSSAGTTITLSGLSLTAAGYYEVHFNFKNSVASDAECRVFFSGDTTAANYYTQAGALQGTSPSAGRTNYPYIGYLYASACAVGTMRIWIGRDGKARAQVFATCANPSASTAFEQHIYYLTAADVTSISFVCQGSAQFTSGDYAVVYRYGLLPTREGTAFPTSGLTSGYRFFRTDLGLDCYYDGTRWLTVQQYERDFQNFGITGTGIQLATHMADGYDIYIEKFFGENFSTTNNGSNYWTFSLYKESVGAYVATLITGAVLSTSASPAGQVGVLGPVTVNAVVTTSTHGRIGLNFAKTGAPSASNFAGGFTFRKIIT